jgi:hypothetical protein
MQLELRGITKRFGSLVANDHAKGETRFVSGKRADGEGCAPGSEIRVDRP